MELKDSITKINLLRAFAGESQARNRYEYAADTAKKEKLNIIENLFKYTADQEKQHAKVFYDLLKEFNGDNIEISAAYPIGNYSDTLSLLKDAKYNENQEYIDVYAEFSKKANEEGFTQIGTTFKNIASIENIHSKRFNKYIVYMQQGNLFKNDTETQWICTNCGYIYEGAEAPKACPVCSHPQGYFLRFEEAEFGKIQ